MSRMGRPRELPRSARTFTLRLPRGHIDALRREAREKSQQSGGLVTVSHLIRNLVEAHLRKVGYVGQK